MSQLTKEDLETLRLQLFADFKQLLESSESEKTPQHRPKVSKEEKEWMRSRDVKRMLSISDAALQNLRIRGLVHPVKISGLYYYRTAEVRSLFKP